MSAQRMTPAEYRAAEGVDQNDPATEFMTSAEEVIDDLERRIEETVPDQGDVDQRDALIESEGILTDRQLRAAEHQAEEATVVGTERQFIAMAKRGQFFLRTHPDDPMAIAFAQRLARYREDTRAIEDHPTTAPDYQQTRVQLLIRAHDDCRAMVQALEEKYGRPAPEEGS